MRFHKFCGDILGVICGSALLVVLAIANTAQAGEQLSGEEIKELLSGNTSRGTNNEGYFFVAKYGEEGSLEVQASKGGWNGSDTGTWQINGDQVCWQMSTWDGGETTCATYETIPGRDGWYLSDRDNGTTAELQFSSD